MDGRARFAALFAAALAGIVPAARVEAAPRPAPRAPRKGDAIPPVEESAAERRAVRGVPVDEAGESPELRDLRRFDDGAFPRGGGTGAPSSGEDEEGPPPSLPGRWLGTGDVPEPLRTPGTAVRDVRRPAPDSDWLRSLQLPDIPVRWEPSVVRYLDWYKNDGKGHAIMGAWLRRLGRYQTLFENALQAQGVPKDLVYLALIESGLDPGSVSRVGAGGIWQFMPGAARAYGLEVSYWVDGRRDPEKAVVAAARYLKDLYVRFGSWELVFAAYNAGYGAVLKSIARYNTNDYWELVRHESGLPWESSVYVPKIVAAAIVGRNRAAFGFGDVEPDPPFACDRVNAAPGTTLAAAARAAGTRLEVLQALNPELIRDRTPPDRPAATLRIPPGTAEMYASEIEHARGAADHVETAVLRFGETIDDVARARGLATKDLRRLNGVRDSGDLRAGTIIVVPKRAEAVATDKDADKAGDGDDEIVVAVPDRVFSVEGRERVFYRTRDGDTLAEIASVFRVEEADLVEWNNVDPDAKLQPKLVLQIFVSKDFDAAGIALLPSERVRVVTLGSQEFLELEAARRGRKRLAYTCKEGDTLVKVGRRYGLTPGDLARINRFSYSTELQAGQIIIVYTPTGEVPREVTMGRSAAGRPEARRPAGKAAPKLAKADGGPRPAAAKGKTAAPMTAKTTAKPTAKPTTAKTTARTTASTKLAAPASAVSGARGKAGTGAAPKSGPPPLASVKKAPIAHAPAAKGKPAPTKKK